MEEKKQVFLFFAIDTKHKTKYNVSITRQIAEHKAEKERKNMANNTNTNTTFSCTQENNELVVSGTFRIPSVYLIEGKRNNVKQVAKGTLLSIDQTTIEYMLSYDIKRRMQNCILPKGLGDTSFVAEGEELRKANGTQTAAQVAERTMLSNIRALRKNVGCSWAEACNMLGVNVPEPEDD